MAGIYGIGENIWTGAKLSLLDIRKGMEKIVSGKEEKEFFFKIYNNTAKQNQHNLNNKTVIIIHW